MCRYGPWFQSNAEFLGLNCNPHTAAGTQQSHGSPLRSAGSYSYDQQYPETAASSEQWNSDCACAPGVETIPHQAVTAPAALVASPAANRIQIGRSTYKVWSTSTPVYLHRRITERVCSRILRSFISHPAAGPLLMRTDFSRRAFRFSAPSVWNSLPQTVLISESVCFLNPDLKLFVQSGFYWTLIRLAASASEVGGYALISINAVAPNWAG